MSEWSRQSGLGGQSGRNGKRSRTGQGDREDGEDRKEGLIPKHGGYRKLKSFQIAQLAFDVTVRFCTRYISKFSRTHDQMVQAARSGVQNIAEGSAASGTSKKTELKLTSVARSSLEELRLDYEDFLRQRELPIWERPDPRRADLVTRRCTSVNEVDQWAKQLLEEQIGSPRPKSQDAVNTPAKSTESTASTLSTASGRATPPEIMANAALVLIAVACGLLDRQLATLAREFEEKGGFTERMYRRRVQKRNSLK